MKAINVAEFKAHLGRYLRAVRQGRTVIVADRGTPVATVAPFAEPRPWRLAVRKAAKPAAELGKRRFAPLRGRPVDSLEYLLVERREK